MSTSDAIMPSQAGAADNNAPQMQLVIGGTRYQPYELLYDIRKEGLDNWRIRMKHYKQRVEQFANNMRNYRPNSARDHQDDLRWNDFD